MSWTIGVATALMSLALPISTAHAGSSNANCAGAEYDDESLASFVVLEGVDAGVDVTIEDGNVTVDPSVALVTSVRYIGPDLQIYKESNDLVTQYGTYHFPGLQLHTHQCTAKTTPSGEHIPNDQWQVFTVSADSLA